MLPLRDLNVVFISLPIGYKSYVYLPSLPGFGFLHIYRDLARPFIAQSMSSIWDKITGKDEPHPDPPQPPVPTATETSTQHVPPKPQEDDHSFSFSKFKDALTGDGSPKGNAPELPPPVASTEARDKDGKDDWHDKVSATIAT